MSTPVNQNKNANIWYKNYMVLVFVIGLPALVVIVCIFFIIYSIKIQDSTVRDDWYMDGKTLYQDASRDQLAHDLNLSGVMRMTPNADATQIEFELRYPSDSLNTAKLADGTALYYPDELSVSISHATDISRDRDFTVHHTDANRYTGTVDLDNLPAKYYLQVSSNDKHNWRLIQHENLPKTNISFLPLSSFNNDGSTLPDQRNHRFTAEQLNQTEQK